MATVLRTLVWAFPKQYEADATVGAQVGIDLEEGGSWVLALRVDGWELDEAKRPSAAAAVAMPGDTSWRMLSGGAYDPATITKAVAAHLVDAVVRVR
jgi:hypothetical protein